MEEQTHEAQLAGLRAQLDALQLKLDESREERNTMLRDRFDLKEQRRYLRNQLREATADNNVERIAYLNSRLSDLAEEVDAMDAQITELETVIETSDDEIEKILESISAAEHAIEEEKTSSKAEEAAENAAGKLEKAAAMLTDFLQKGAHHIADKIENVDFDQVGNTVSNAAGKAAQLAADAAKSAQSVYHDVAEKCVRTTDAGDFTVYGTGNLNAGTYNRISISGFCKATGDVSCKSIQSNGSFRAAGSVSCEGEIKTSGGFHCDGDVSSSIFQSVGSSKIQGSLTTGYLYVPGVLSVGGAMKSAETKVSGSLRAGAELEAESLTVTGSMSVKGNINADVIDIRLSIADSSAEDIGGSSISVSQTPSAGILNEILKPDVGTLHCRSIEGDHVDLAGVVAGSVRGTNVIIRKGCTIDRVEYSQTCSVDAGSVVHTCVKI